MKRLSKGSPVFLLSLAVLYALSCSRTPAKPKLIVTITLDQFRAGYLESYDSVFQGGFRRLLDEGRYYPRAVVDHAPTLSWPGHTTIATGTYPKHHGILANAYIYDKTQRRLFLHDEDHIVIGSPNSRNYSWAKIRVTGLADWIHESDPGAESVALSTGPGLSVCYGGHDQSDRTKNHVYWLDMWVGGFVTSSYYRDDYPEWIRNFNSTALPRYKESTIWECSVPVELRHLARADEASYEKEIGGSTTFPHDLRHDMPEVNEQALNYWFYNYNPHADEALFALARDAVRALELGQRGSTDFLAIAVKSTDRIGHDCGPRSLEQMDILYRLDRELGTFFDFLDRTVGRDDYLVSLQADHGAPNVVEYEIEEGRPAKRVTEEELKTLLTGIGLFIDGYTGPPEELPDRIARELEKCDFIARAMTSEELEGTGPADHILESYRNSYVAGYNTTFPLWTNEILGGIISPNHPGNFGIRVEFIEQAQLYTAPSAHSTSYPYDQEVPIVFMGRDVRPGVVEEPARTIDIAPTLAYLAGIEFPETVDGKVLEVQ